MKIKTINKILDNKFESFAKSIKCEKTRRLVEGNTIITGGAIASMLLQEDVNDYDMYFRDLETTLAVAGYYVKQFKKSNPNVNMIVQNSADKEDFSSIVGVWDEGDEDWVKEKPRVTLYIRSVGVVKEKETLEGVFDETLGNLGVEGDSEDMLGFAKQRTTNSKNVYKPIFFTSNAITLSNDIQLVLRFYGPPEEIHENYDYIHCTNYWTSWNKELVLNLEALKSLMSRDLKYSGSLYPICSIIRMRKFIKRGWTITVGEIFKMCYQISKLDLDDFKVMNEQLIGVDVAYFNELICSLKEAKDTGKNIDYGYLVTLIDEIF